MTIYADQAQQFRTHAAVLTQYVFMLLSFLVYFTGYIIQYFKFSYLLNIIQLVQKCLLKLTRIINQQRANNYTDLTIRFMLKFVIVFILTVYSEYNQVDFITEFGTNNVILKVCSTFPSCIFCIAPNVFYAGILLACHYYRQLNYLITEIVKSSNQIAVAENHRQYQMTRFCELSDRLDEISVLHTELSNLTKSWNLLFSIPIFLWVWYKTAFLIVCLFFNYVVIRDLLISKDEQRLESRIGITSYTGLEMVIVALELFLVANGCFNAEFEVMIYRIYFIDLFNVP